MGQEKEVKTKFIIQFTLSVSRVPTLGWFSLCPVVWFCIETFLLSSDLQKVGQEKTAEVSL